MFNKIKIVLTRDSVCQADDLFAPNEKVLFFSTKKNISDLTNEIFETHYLAKIFGGKATWVMRNENTRVAVIAQQWTSAKFLVDHKLSINNFKKTSECIHIHFEYLDQQDPDIVYKSFIVATTRN